MKIVKIASVLIVSIFFLAGCRNGQPANTVNTPQDASGSRIGVLYGTSSIGFASGTGEAALYYTTNELMDALKAGALDCVLMESGPADSLASKTSGVKLLNEPLLEYDLSFAIAKENADLTRAVNSALLTLSENGVLKGLRDKFVMGKNYTYTGAKEAAEPRGTLTLAVPGDFPPYSYKNDTGEFSGFDIEIARAVCDILAVELEVIETDSKNLLTTVQFGKADFALGNVHDNEEDGKIVDFSDAYTHFAQMIIVRK